MQNSWKAIALGVGLALPIPSQGQSILANGKDLTMRQIGAIAEVSVEKYTKDWSKDSPGGRFYATTPYGVMEIFFENRSSDVYTANHKSAHSPWEIKTIVFQTNPITYLLEREGGRYHVKGAIIPNLPQTGI